MRIVVLGAGLVGVASAWFLAEDGHVVSVVDQHTGPARDTSFANGGQISTSHAEPWANPAAPLKILKWLGREDAPLLWRLRADSAQWAWGLRFLGECLPGRTRANIRAILGLALYSRARLKTLRRQLGLDYDCLERGILHYYTDANEFERAKPQAEFMRRFGCDRVVVSGAECLDIEPALASSLLPIVGGTWTVDDESGDARRFTERLAARCAVRGVNFLFGNSIAGIDCPGDRFGSVRLTNGERVEADACVVALGSYSTLLLRPLNIPIPVYPAKGYSVTIPLRQATSAPVVSLTDDGAKLVYARLGDRLRVAGTAEFAGYDTTVNPARVAALVRRIRQIFPHLEFRDDAIEPWAGLRPATPSNVPLIGPTRVDGLFLNTGHGTLGWTLAVGSGRMLADLVTGRSTALDPAPYRVLR